MTFALGFPAVLILLCVFMAAAQVLDAKLGAAIKRPAEALISDVEVLEKTNRVAM